MAEKHVVGVTTNPTIFASALAKGEKYDDQVAGLTRGGASTDETIFEITTDDVRNACDVMREAYDASGGKDGRVSIEVSPNLAFDTEGTIESARQLWRKVDRPNLFIKIPATTEGLPAITETLGQGISVNVTLIFGLERYEQVMDAFLEGVEQARTTGADLSDLQSVASFFVSRVDTEIDKRLEKIGSDEALALRGKAAVANAVLAYERYEKKFAGGPLAGARRGRGAAPASAVGLHRGEEPGLLRHALRHRPDHGEHREHDAGEDARRLRRARRGAG